MHKNPATTADINPPIRARFHLANLLGVIGSVIFFLPVVLRGSG
jgi:hypothetical protein